MINIWKRLGRAAVAAASLFATQQAMAAGTLVNTPVENTVTVTYSIGTPQTPVTDTHEFRVDRKIDVVVEEDGSTNTSVVPGAVNQVTKFTVSNESNDTIDVALTTLFDQTTMLPKTNRGGPTNYADTFTATSPVIYLDNGDGNFSAVTDTVVTNIDALEPTVGPGNPATGTRTIFVAVSVPSGALNNQIEIVTLTAQARQNDGTPATVGDDFDDDSGIADTPGTVQTVLADADGPATGDGARDGQHSDTDGYLVEITALTVEKSATVLSHTIGGDTINTNPKAIPGALIEYCVQMTNNDAQAATAVTLSDPLPDEVEFVAGSLQSGATCATATNGEDDDNTGAGDDDGFSASYSGTTVSGVVDSIAGNGGTAALRFNVRVK